MTYRGEGSEVNHSQIWTGTTWVSAFEASAFIKQPVLCATTANITLSGEQTIDGVLTSSSRVLVKNQATLTQNGIYVSAAGAWSRSTDADTDSEVISGMTVFVERGSTNAGQHWVLTTFNPIVVGATGLSFQQRSATLSTNNPLNVGSAADPGTAQTISRSDHVHAHGNQAGGSLHAVATTSVHGFMSSTDKTKLDGFSAASNYLLLTGGTMSGAIDMGGNNITTVGTVDGVDVASHASRHISGAADEVDGDQLDIDWNPSNYTPSTAPAEAFTVDHLTAHLAGIDNALGATTTSDFKESVDLATTADITLSGEQTIDGVLTSTSRILVKNQVTASENGLYTTGAGAWTRTSDADTDAKVTTGLTVYVSQGTTNEKTLWTLTTTGAITVGVTSLTFELTLGEVYLQLSGAVAMTGNLNMGTNDITNVGTVDGVDVSALFTYAFDHDSDHISGGGDEIDGDQIDIDFTPTTYTPSIAPAEVTSTSHLTAHLAGLDSIASQFFARKFKDSVRVATTVDITLSGTQTIDDIALSVNDRVLVKNQSTASENGLYLVQAGSWTRAAETNTGTRIEGMVTFAVEGTVNGNTLWGLTTPSPISLGSTSLTYELVSEDQFLLLDGTNTMSGNLDMGTNNITNVGTVDGIDVTAHASRHISAGADEIDGDQLDIDWNPGNYTPTTSPTEATSIDHLTAHLAGIDNQFSIVANNIDYKASVQVATTADITLSGEQTIDGVLTSASRVLVKNQVTASENGIYVSAAGAWSRASDANTSAKVTSGLFTYVEEGTNQGGQHWKLSTTGSIVLDTTSLTFDPAHGNLEGGALHETATTTTAGFMSPTDKEAIEPVIDFEISTTDATPVTAGTIAIADDTVVQVFVRMSCKDSSGNRATETLMHEFHREGAGSAAQVGTAQTLKAFDGIGITGITFDVSGNNGVIEFTGAAATTISGTVKVWAEEFVDP